MSEKKNYWLKVRGETVSILCELGNTEIAQLQETNKLVMLNRIDKNGHIKTVGINSSEVISINEADTVSLRTFNQ